MKEWVIFFIGVIIIFFVWFLLARDNVKSAEGLYDSLKYGLTFMELGWLGVFLIISVGIHEEEYKSRKKSKK